MKLQTSWYHKNKGKCVTWGSRLDRAQFSYSFLARASSELIYICSRSLSFFLRLYKSSQFLRRLLSLSVPLSWNQWLPPSQIFKIWTSDKKPPHLWPDSHNVQVKFQTSSDARRPQWYHNGGGSFVFPWFFFFFWRGGGALVNAARPGDRAGWQGCDWERITCYKTSVHVCVCVWGRQKVVITGCVKGKKKTSGVHPRSPLIRADHDNHGCHWCAVTLTSGNRKLLPPSVCLRVCVCVSGDFVLMLSHCEYQRSVCFDLCGRAAAAAAAAVAACLSFRRRRSDTLLRQRQY